METLTIVSAADTDRGSCYPRAAFRDANAAAEYADEIDDDVAYTSTHEVPVGRVDENGSDDAESDGHECDECGRTFDSPQALAGHMNGHGDDEDG